MKNLLNWVCGILASVVILGLMSCEKPPETLAEKSADDIAEETSPFETTASDIARAYADNQVAADNQFKDTTFNVTGTIVAVSKNFIQEPHVSLAGGVDSDREPQFVFQQSEKDKASSLKVGQEVHLQCIGQGDLAEVPMAGECKLLN